MDGSLGDVGLESMTPGELSAQVPLQETEEEVVTEEELLEALRGEEEEGEISEGDGQTCLSGVKGLFALHLLTHLSQPLISPLGHQHLGFRTSHLCHHIHLHQRTHLTHPQGLKLNTLSPHHQAQRTLLQKP